MEDAFSLTLTPVKSSDHEASEGNEEELCSTALHALHGGSCGHVFAVLLHNAGVEAE